MAYSQPRDGHLDYAVCVLQCGTLSVGLGVYMNKVPVVYLTVVTTKHKRFYKSIVDRVLMK